MMDGKELLASYERAGNDFLASRLEGAFRLLKTQEDVALHNVIVEEILAMVSGKEKVNTFYRLMARSLFEKQAKRSFLKIAAEAIFGRLLG